MQPDHVVLSPYSGFLFKPDEEPKFIGYPDPQPLAVGDPVPY